MRIREALKHTDPDPPCGSGTLVKSHKEVTKQWKSRYFLLFLLVTGGSRAGSVLVTNVSGCGSGRSKNIGSYGFGSGCGSGSTALVLLLLIITVISSVQAPGVCVRYLPDCLMCRRCGAPTSWCRDRRASLTKSFRDATYCSHHYRSYIKIICVEHEIIGAF
jgi:hypothetical protein